MMSLWALLLPLSLLGPGQSVRLGRASGAVGKVDLRTCNTTRFIHIGKTGGTHLINMWNTAVYAASAAGYNGPLGANFETCVRDWRQCIPFHNYSWDDAFPDDCFYFFVRDPVDRWVSGFLSRLRKGCPSSCSPWKPTEE